MTSYFEIGIILSILMLPIFYEKSHAFRYYFKFLVYYLVVSVNAIILIPAFLCRPCDARNLLWASAFCHHISTFLGFKWELRGREHLEKDRACIIVANHQSSLDVLGMFDIWPIMQKCTVVAKKELLYAQPFGLAAWLCGLIFIDRVRSDKARNTLNAANHKIKSKNIKLWVFPEGTRHNTGKIHEFKKGAFHMAVDAQIPILPVVYSSYVSFLDSKRKILNPGNIIITTLPAIPTDGLTKDDIPKLMDEVHLLMSEVFKKTSREILDRYLANSKDILNTRIQVITNDSPLSDESNKNIDVLNKSNEELFQDIRNRKQQRTFKDAVVSQ